MATSPNRSNPYIIFQPSEVSRAQIVAAARRYLGLRYSMRGADVQYDEQGRASGQVDCLRFLLLVARDCGYLPADFDLNTNRPRPKLNIEDLMWEVLHHNLTEIPKEQARPGDIYLVRYSDVQPTLQRAHHVAIRSKDTPAPRGSLIHAINKQASGAGCVLEQRIDALEWTRIDSAWRMPSIID